MPRNRPDLSQRPRREAPGMLTGMAILERELGINDYTRHVLGRRLRAGADDEASIRAEIAELEERREATLRLLEQMHDEHAERRPDAGRAARARP